MRKKITILSAEILNNRLLLHANESIRHLESSGQMLVDSDELSFIYLMEDSEDYTYIVLPEQIWTTLRSAYEQKNSVFLTSSLVQIELTNFQEELEYLLSNIEGNSNYGEEMVTKVDHHFKLRY